MTKSVLLKPGFHVIVSVERIVSAPANNPDDHMETQFDAIQTIVRIELSSILMTETTGNNGMLFFYGVISVSKLSFRIRNAKMQSTMQKVNLRIQKCQFMKREFHREMQNPIPESRTAVDNANRSCGSSIHQVKCARQKVKNRIRNVNALRLLNFWRDLLATCVRPIS